MEEDTCLISNDDIGCDRHPAHVIVHIPSNFLTRRAFGAGEAALSKRVIVNVDIVSDDIAEPGEVSSPAAIGPLQQLVPQPPEIL